MINSFVPRKSYSSLITALLVVATLTGLFLFADEVLLAGLNKHYILFSALLILAISFSILAFRSYSLYKNLQLFLPDLWSSKILSASTEYMIFDNNGRVFISSGDEIINFCNSNIRKFFHASSGKDFPKELIHENKLIKLYKLKDVCESGLFFADCVLVTIIQNSKTNLSLREYWHVLVKSMKVPAYIEEYNGSISGVNEALLNFIGVSSFNNVSNIAFQSHKKTDIVSMFYNLEKISDFTRVKIYENAQEKYFILLNNIQKTEQNSLSDDYPIPVLTIDNEANIKTSNDAFYRMLGLECSVRLKPLTNYLDEASKNSLLSYIDKQDGKDLSFSFEARFNSNDIVGLFYITYVAKANNYFCHIIDITEYKKMEMNFIHSQKMQAIGQLSGGIAHDFNNLLTAILGFCDLLLIRHSASDPAFGDIMQIKQNANRAANLVKQLLAISRKQVLKTEIIDVTTVIAELSNLIRRLIGEGVALKVNHGKDLMIKADHSQLEQVIMNLAVNARDAMGSKGCLTINTSEVVIKGQRSIDKNLVAAFSDETITPGRYVLIEVIDTGKGIPKNIISKVFEPFFSTKEVGAGTGLGLSTVHGIVKQTGGYLYVDSTEGVGTRFCIYFKSADEKDVTKMRSKDKNKHKKELISKDLTGDSTILLVEDEAPVRMFSAHALSNKGYKVIEAESGEEAMSIVKERGKEISLIITDVIMPGMNGPSFIAEIQKTYPNIKVIFMSGYAEEAFADTYAIGGSFHFLSKPFTLEQLASKVKDIIPN